MADKKEINVTKPKHIFRQDSKDFKFMLKLFRNGKIKASDAPASVRAKFPSKYGKYTTGQFRSQFNKAKGMAGIQCRFFFVCSVTIEHWPHLFYFCKSIIRQIIEANERNGRWYK